MDELIDLDRHLLLLLNGSGSLFLDGLMKTFTTAYTWIPLYIALFWFVVRNNENTRQILIILGCVALCLLLTSGVTDMIIKPSVSRWRPSHDPVIADMIDTVNGYRGGKYGFFSAHAANTFGIALFFTLMVKNRALSISLIIWSLLNCFTRLYLGVHFPGDIIFGLLWASIAATLSYTVYRLGVRRMGADTSKGWRRTGSTADMVLLVLYLSYAFVVIKACFII